MNGGDAVSQIRVPFLVLRFIRSIHRDAPVLVFPAKAGTHVWDWHRPSPVWQKLSALVCSCRVNLLNGSEH
jgi:hypothetical protein